jgi:TP901 family phage tail tape measure protein
MNKALEIAIVLRAYDKMSKVIDGAVSHGAKKLGQLKDRADKVAASSFKFARDAAMVGLAIGTPIAYATNQAVKFEDAMADVSKVLGVAVGSSEFAQVGEEAKKTAVYLGIAGEQSAALYAGLAAGGVAREELAGVSKMAGEMGVAFNMSADMAGTSFIKIKNALGQTIPETKKVTDAINYLSDKTASEAGEIVNYMANGGSSVARSFGLAGEQSAAFGATLISMGKSSSEAATIMERFAKGVFNDAGMKSIFDQAGGGVQGFMAVLEQGKNSADPFAFFKKFGQYGTDISGMAANFGDLQKNVGLVADETKYLNSVTAEFKNRNSTTGGQIRKLKAEFQVLAINLGTSMLPVLKKLMADIAPILRSTAAWISRNPKLTATIVKIAAATAAFSLAISGVSFAYGGVFKALGMFARMGGGSLKLVKWLSNALFMLRYRMVFNVIPALWGVISATWAWTTALLANPITWIVLAIIVFIAQIALLWYGIYKLVKNWDKVKAWLIASFHKFVAFFTGLGKTLYNAGANIIGSIWNGMKSKIMGPINLMKSMAQKIRDFLPFSPAKTGALKDIHRIKLFETIAGSMKPAPMIKAMDSSMQAFASRRPGVSLNGGGGGISITYAPVIHMAGGESKADFMAMLMKHKDELGKLIEEKLRLTNRGKF